MNRAYLKWIMAFTIVLTLLVCILCGCANKQSIGAGTKNKAAADAASILTKPVLSDVGGFYAGKMELEISVPEALKNDTESVRVTFDGSEPTKKSKEYKSAINLPGDGCIKTDFSSKSENVAVSVVRAACFDASGNIIGQISTGTYIQMPDVDGKTDMERFDMPVISLVTDEENLDDPDTGIFANIDGRGSEWERPVNVSFYEADGTLAFSQDAGIRLFGGSTRTLTQKSLRITARKSQDFSTTVYDGAGKFKYALFPGRTDSSGELLTMYDSFVLRNGGNDSVFFSEDASRITFLRDGIAAKISKQAAPEVDVMDYRPVIVFINGEYYGLMNMREYQNKKYIQNVYGIEDEEGITVISTEMDTSRGGRYEGDWFYYEQDNGPEGDLENFTTLLNDIASGKYTFDQAAEYIDMNNFMKYCAMNLFLCNTDWPHNNTKVWRYAGSNPGANADSSVTDGKWRFMLKDADLGLGRFVCAFEKPSYPIELYTKADSQNIRFLLANYMTFPNSSSGYPSIAENTYPDTLKIQALFYFCIQNEGFASSFFDFCEELVTEIWTPKALETFILDSASEISSEFKNYLIKDFGVWQWEANIGFSAWQSAVGSPKDSLVTWAKERSGADGEFMKQVNELRNLL